MFRCRLAVDVHVSMGGGVAVAQCLVSDRCHCQSVAGAPENTDCGSVLNKAAVE